jgi:hypothetical protein
MRGMKTVLVLLSISLASYVMAAPPPPEIAKTVTFIFLAGPDGNPQVNAQTGDFVANGTGFFVLIPNEDKTGGHGYLVTAKHVLQNSEGDFFKRVFLRVNDKKGGAEFGAIDLVPSGPTQNVFWHDDQTVDVAVIPVLPSLDRFDFLAIAPEMIKSRDDFKNTTIMAGSDVFFVGLFTPHYGDKRNTPIFRFGRVAMLTDDPIRWQEAGKPPVLGQLYLLETMSFGGNSGSPVFFMQGVDRQPGTLVVGAPEITLAGVMRGNFNEPRVGGLIQTPNAVLPVFSQNIGIAAVTPAHLLREILYSEKLNKQRADHPVVVPERK